MFDPSKKIDSKYLAPILLFLIVGLLIIFGFFGAKGFFTLALIALFFFQKKIFKNFDFANFLTNLSYKNDMTNQMPDVGDYSQQLGGVWKIAKIIILIILAIWMLSWFVVIVGAGETGVYVLFGKVRDQELSSGFHLVNPLAKIQKMSIRTEQYTMSIYANEGQKKGDDFDKRSY